MPSMDAWISFLSLDIPFYSISTREKWSIT
jgi:hypothetical protein